MPSSQLVLPDGYVLVDGAPPLDAYLRLRAESGLSPKTAEQGGPALANSWAFCHVRHESSGDIAAMGRVIGDGGWYFHIADIATLPAHQRQGLGSAVMTWLMDEIARRAPGDAYVSLMADAAGVALYERHGFINPAPRSTGMAMWLRKNT